MEKINFDINDKTYQVSIDGAPPFSYGKEELLSNAQTDITFSQDWYSVGYSAKGFLDNDEFRYLREGLTKCVQNIISTELGADIEGFELNNYHHFVTTNELHFKVVSKTRDLFPSDFNFPLAEIIPKFEKILGFKLTDISPFDGSQLHIILRINRPNSTDYNPPHKDIYEGVDNLAHIPKFINMWVPVCGVTQKSSLPVAPLSHLLPENQILRTFEGGIVEGNKYRVRMIKEWAGSNKLIRPVVEYGEVLLFSAHLVHGLAINEEDQTRVALEFRLFRQD